MWNQVGIYDGFSATTFSKNINERERSKKRSDRSTQGGSSASFDCGQDERKGESSHENTEQG